MRIAPAPGSPPPYRPGTLPLAWQTRIPPGQVLINVTRTGEPIAKGRPQLNRKTGNVYTPKRTVEAEEAWRWVMRAARRHPEPARTEVGILVFFRLSSHRRCDGDNLLKLVLDAAQSVIVANDDLITETHCHLLRGVSDPGTDLLAWLR